MQYDQQDLVRDFARRTRQNLEFVRSARTKGADVYETTQLVNSMLGLLVFPQQRYVDSIPATSVEVLERQGWPIPHVSRDYDQVQDLNQLIRYLRNAIAHCNLEFLSDADMEVRGVRVWNVNTRDQVTWMADLSMDELERLTEKFLELLLTDSDLARP